MSPANKDIIVNVGGRVKQKFGFMKRVDKG